MATKQRALTPERCSRDFEGPGLAFGIAADGRASADHRIMVPHFVGTGAGDQFGEGLAADASKREINDIRVAEEIVKKRLDGFQCVGSAELE